MADYEDDDLEDVDNNQEPPVEEAAAAGAAAGAASGSRNFLLALGILGGIFVLLIVALAILFLTRRNNTPPATSNVELTNVAIMTANAQTAVAATQTVSFMLTPSATAEPTETPLVPTATNTQVLAQATATQTSLPEQAAASTSAAATAALAAGTPGGGQGGAPGSDGYPAPVNTLAPGPAATATRLAQVTLDPARRTQTAAAASAAGTATKLPSTGFAEDVGLPGLFGMAIGLVLVIVLVRRLRLSGAG